MTNFKGDLKLGNKYEIKATGLFEYDSCDIKKGKFKAYDFSFKKDNKETFVEVKSDRIAHKTGNLCIEYKCNNLDSGITTTTAHYWVYYVIGDKKDDVYIIPTDELRKIACSFRSVNGGDGFRSKMYLVPRTKLIKYLHLE
jgi:hypothetical protein